MRLNDYLARLGIVGPLDANITTLRRLHLAHRETFLFENLSIQEGAGVSVALEDIERKFLNERRGGYCFEHNSLFAAVLRDCGFPVVPLLGRVRRGPPERWARTHMVLKVGSQGSQGSQGSAGSQEDCWLADVGFGALGLLEPIPLKDGASAKQGGLIYCLRKDGSLWILSMRDSTQSMDLYEFAEDPQTFGDIVVANHYTSTHPESMFRRSLTIQSVQGDRRTILRTDVLSRYVAGVLTEEPVDRARLRDVARELFDVELPSGPLVYESDALST
jgi:N-hydroxyarylamine O-acetyltransferase